MASTTIYEFDCLFRDGAGLDQSASGVPPAVFSWLEHRALLASERGDAPWLRITQRGGRRAIQVTSFVGVIRAPGGYQIEVLPKVGRAFDGGAAEARNLLIRMLKCLNGFRHVQTDSALLAATRMPLFEVFIAEFLASVERVVKRGLRSAYAIKQDHLFTLRGKLLVSQHVRHNLHRADRFFTEHDEFSANRPENRLLHTALLSVLSSSTRYENQKLARELGFVFADVPVSSDISTDLQRVRLDRGMGYYSEALAWARLILEEESPLTGAGRHDAPSLLFPMEAVFEAYVEKHLARQLAPGLRLRAQAKTLHLVRHRENNWFRLKPDLLIHDGRDSLVVLDTKWKVLDSSKFNGTDKYGLSQSDFYQLYAYGLHYIDGQGDVVLIYPKTDALPEPLEVFHFPQATQMRLWVLPFCLKAQCLLLPDDKRIRGMFKMPDKSTSDLKVPGANILPDVQLMVG